MTQMATLASLPSTRREILNLLKERGGVRAEELATALGITVSAIRQHLSALDANGLVSHREVKGGPGRPKFVFHLAPAAEALFPQGYSELANELLDLFKDEDPAVVDRVWDRMAERSTVETRAEVGDRPFAERVQIATRIFERRGFLPRVDELPGGGYRFALSNCPVYEVAKRHGRVCECEQSVLTAAFPDADITHTGVMLKGEHACVYECLPKKSTRNGHGSG